MDLQLQGKRALVTGSSSGIGEWIARTPAAEGLAEVVYGRREQEAIRVAEITATGGKAAVALGGPDSGPIDVPSTDVVLASEALVLAHAIRL